MKTALELLGRDRKRLVGVLCDEGEDRDMCAICKKTIKSLELVAQRAREEMREAAANEALMNRETMANLYSKIRKLPVTP